jgi:6-hydroxy-3-succinoylpyridine 3-monooxygenase
MKRLRTRIYVDGYNFYYGRLKGTKFKWLDIVAIFETQILPSVLFAPPPSLTPTKMELLPCAVKYFTAPILERLAKGADSVSSQSIYHNALKQHCGDKVEFVMGYYSLYPANLHIVPAEDPETTPKDCPKILVWKPEEKQTDVNMALHAYDDARSGEVDQIVFVTNDTDLAPAMEMIRARCKDVVLGLVIPTRPGEGGDSQEREANGSLRELADWTRRSISDDELAASQLPPVVAGTSRRPSIKPDSWYANPANLAKLLEMARPVLGKRGAVMKWGSAANGCMGGKKPIDLIETEEGAQVVFDYIERYIAEKVGWAGDGFDQRAS